jgi:AraC-like DNA-binding protein
MLLTHEFKKTTSRPRAEPVEIWKARKLIHEQLQDDLSLKKVAQAVNRSMNHFSEKFKQVTGMNFVDYVSQLRFERAQTLLQKSDLRISEIAFAVGFRSLSQFNRVFRRLAGQSPTQYRAILAARGNNGKDSPKKCVVS